VNKKIKKSLEDEYEIDFWWLNNGITVIAESPTQVGKTLSIENVQIVNGLQTTFTLEKHFAAIEAPQEEQRSILVKVIILDSVKNKNAIDKIIASTNSQNAVPPVLLRATDDIQRRIELYFSNSSYFYDRRKNYYKNMGKPASRIFSIQTAAQAIQSIVVMEPDTARAKPTTLIKKQESYEKIFNDNIDFKVYLNCCLISKNVREFIKTQLEGEDKSYANAYSLHLTRILASLLTKKAHYSIDKIKNLEVETISNESLTEGFKILKGNVEEFKKISKTVSDSSLSKSGPFREYLNDALLQMYPD